MSMSTGGLLLVVQLPRVSPMLLLGVLVGITLISAIAQRFIRRSRRKSLTALARQWHMHYTPRDIFNLASRIASMLPTPGAADVHVSDLIYGTEAGGHRYIFCAEYTIGVVRAKKRQRCVASVFEPRQRSDGADWASLQVAPCELDLIDQYRSVGRQTATGEATSKA